MFEYLTIEDKLDFIDDLKQYEYLSNEKWDMLAELVKDEEQEIRLNVSEILALFPTEMSEKLLLYLLNDSNYLVRASACDSLSFSKSEETLHKLLLLTNDKKYLVRGYAILSIGDIQLKVNSNFNLTIEYLMRLESEEKSQWVKIAIYRSLFLLGDLSYYKELLCMIENRYYHNRSFALSLIEELVDNNRCCELIDLETTLKNRLLTERAYSVKLKLYKILDKVTKQKQTQGDGSVCSSNDK